MDSIIHGATVYLFLLVIFRIAGKRTLAHITTFDLVLTLIISESIQQAMLDRDDSITNAFLLVITLVGLNIVLSLLKQRSKAVEKVLDGVPVVILDDGVKCNERMDRERVDVTDILAAAREQEGARTLDQVRYAVLERSGQITVILRESS